MENPQIIISRIIKITPTIIDEITILGQQLYGSYTKATCTKWLNKLSNFPSAYFFVARIKPSRKIIGMLNMVSYPALDGYYKTWIEGVVVSPESRGHGVGIKLLTTALQTAKQLGLECVSLTSKPSRIEANKLYQKVGFQKYKTNCYKYLII